MRRAGKAAIWAGAAISGVGALAVPAWAIGRSATEPITQPAGPSLVERMTCAGDDTPQAAEAPGHTGAQTPAVSQTVSVVVPRVAMIEFGADGRVVAAATNTGCAPRPGDEVYIVLDDGNLVAASDFALDGIEWRGDFTAAGVFQAQQS